MKQDNIKYTHLLKNTLVFGIGTFGSKVLQFFIVPLYTYVLTTEEYGKIDIFATTISLVLPFITFLIQESIIRFLTSNEIEKDDAINSGMIIFLNSVILSLFLTSLYMYIFDKEYAVIFFVCLVLNSFVAIFQNYLKACGQVADFTICGIINTGVFLASNIVMLLVFRLGIIGYLCSMIISQLASAIFIIARGKIFKKISFNRKSFKLLNKLLKFSIPLIPNNLMWWIMNAGDKYVINYFLGNSANGLYSISIKLATIITTLFGIFMQAWQLSAIEENGKEKQAEFYSKVYSNMMLLLLETSAVILIVNRPIFSLIIGDQFFEAHLYSPLLCVATVINCISTFLGVTYLVSKSTSKAFTTTVVGAITNVIANILLIKVFGLGGVALGTIIGYVVVMLIRMRDTVKYVHMDLDIIRTLIGILLLLSAAIVYMFVSFGISICIGIVTFGLVALLYKNNIVSLVFMVLRKTK